MNRDMNQDTKTISNRERVKKIVYWWQALKDYDFNKDNDKVEGENK